MLNIRSIVVLFFDKFIMEYEPNQTSQTNQPLPVNYINIMDPEYNPELKLQAGLHYLYTPGMPGEYFYRSSGGDTIEFRNPENPIDGLTYMTIKYHPQAASELLKIDINPKNIIATNVGDYLNMIKMFVPPIKDENIPGAVLSQSAGSRNRRSRKNRSKKSKKSKSRKH